MKQNSQAKSKRNSDHKKSSGSQEISDKQLSSVFALLRTYICEKYQNVAFESDSQAYFSFVELPQKQQEQFFNDAARTLKVRNYKELMSSFNENYAVTFFDKITNDEKNYIQEILTQIQANQPQMKLQEIYTIVNKEFTKFGKNFLQTALNSATSYYYKKIFTDAKQ